MCILPTKQNSQRAERNKRSAGYHEPVWQLEVAGRQLDFALPRLRIADGLLALCTGILLLLLTLVILFLL
jgi:hypothetical protein